MITVISNDELIVRLSNEDVKNALSSVYKVPLKYINGTSNIIFSFPYPFKEDWNNFLLEDKSADEK